MHKHEKKIHMYASKLCAAISDDFRNSPEMVRLFIQWGSFDIGLIRVRASPEFTTVTSTMSRLNFRTYINHCAASCQLGLKEYLGK